MLTKEGCLARRQRLWNAVPEQAEWLLIADPRHVNYLCNFLVHPLSFAGGERGLLLLEREGKATLLGDNFALRCAASMPYIDEEIEEKWYDHKHSVINRDHALLNALKKVSDKIYGRPGIVEAEWLPVGAWEILAADQECHSVTRESAQVGNSGPSNDLGTVIRELRRRKHDDEIKLMRICMKAGNAGHQRAKEVIRPGITEFELYREVQQAALAAADRPGLVYGDFRATNATNFKAGGLPTDYELQNSDMFILDYSVVLDGYRSDFTNTLCVGEPNADQQRMFDACQVALKAGREAIKPGAAAADVYRAVSHPLEEAGFGSLVHHAGHGLGLAHPETPILVPESEDTLVKGDVITIEPGVYVEGVGGIRIEDNYLVTNDGAEKLNDHVISMN